ncbi:DIA2 [[Candida] subhashii]|uniref:DIA2 n=1 Tax=[Candida] subhashii TaxID=561895 RepID=A0A8J5QLT4_9ASCO|nr:DIA2 [[Candida] subhashii]KAG7662936.1 DIA2 [[Candida] subhashii]
MSDSQLIEDKTQLAIIYFKSQDYVKALGIYNQLISQLSSRPQSQIKLIRKQHGLAEKPIMGPIIHPKICPLYDQRAATFEKLGQVANALLDAKKLMELDPLGCKGYLRRGKLLYNMGKTVEAYKCYQTGVYIIEKAITEFQISVPEKLFMNLKSQYRKLNSELKTKRRAESEEKQRQIKKPKRVLDPFHYLPQEIIGLIFKDLELKSILQCHLVCKTWYFALISLQELYNSRINLKQGITLNEFTNASRLLKKINSKRFSIKFNSIHSPSLNKILETLIVQPISIERLELLDRNMTISLLLDQLIKSSWKLRNFQNLQTLKLTINEDLSYGGRLLLNQFKSLKELQLLVTKPGETNYPRRDKIFQKLKQQSPDSYQLQCLTLVNHPSKISTIRMLDLNFPNLTDLTIVSYEFNDKLSEFGEFLIRCTKLEKIYFENNSNLSFFTFLILLKNFNPKFSLKELTFREGGKDHSMISLNEVNEIVQFKQLTKLDIYNHNLSSHGLIKLLKICGAKLTSLNIGNGKYISFSKYSPQSIHISNIFNYCINLSQLYLNEMNIDNDSIIQIAADLNKVQHDLNYLDISFNERIDGINLIKLCNGFKQVDTLVIHGLEISKDTLNYLIKQNFVERFVFGINRNRWRTFGLNSWIQ